VKGFASEVRKALLEAGCWFWRQGRGDHEVWKSPDKRKPFTVPTKIMSRHTANKIMKDAGLPKRFD
jgi:predicted RNA binding protein YcfA (HicA-like mRNA interferase family)